MKKYVACIVAMLTVVYLCSCSSSVITSMEKAQNRIDVAKCEISEDVYEEMNNTDDSVITKEYIENVIFQDKDTSAMVGDVVSEYTKADYIPDYFSNEMAPTDTYSTTLTKYIHDVAIECGVTDYVITMVNTDANGSFIQVYFGNVVFDFVCCDSEDGDSLQVYYLKE